jgi:MFS family permease
MQVLFGVPVGLSDLAKKRPTQHSAMMFDPEDRGFIGHPRALGYIAFAEAWERFSYYGMQALLVLYMVNRLLHPGHIEHIAGFPPFRHLIETFRGPLSVQALASTIFGLYTGLVYLTPIAGGLIADRILGRTRTITIGALLMSAGHFLMAFDVSFLLPSLVCSLVSAVSRATSRVRSARFMPPATIGAPTLSKFIICLSTAVSSPRRSLPAHLVKRSVGITDLARPESVCLLV